MFDEIDKLFINIILKQRKVFEDVEKLSLDYKILLTKENMDFTKLTVDAEKNKKITTHNIIIVGVYDIKKELFMWSTDINLLLLELLTQHDLEKDIGSMRTLEKLFKLNVNIILTDHYVIPCLIGIYNQNMNIISFHNDGYIMYALINLGIKDDFDYEQYLKYMRFYKLATSNDTNILAKILTKKITAKNTIGRQQISKTNINHILKRFVMNSKKKSKNNMNNILKRFVVNPKKGSKKDSKKGSKKDSKKGSKKDSKKGSKKGSKKLK
jgi:hypothetical protein